MSLLAVYSAASAPRRSQRLTGLHCLPRLSLLAQFYVLRSEGKANTPGEFSMNGALQSTIEACNATSTGDKHRLAKVRVSVNVSSELSLFRQTVPAMQRSDKLTIYLHILLRTAALHRQESTHWPFPQDIRWMIGVENEALVYAEDNENKLQEWGMKAPIMRDERRNTVTATQTLKGDEKASIDYWSSWLVRG